ncbi:CU044_5270 family protein [Nonomuraea aurantiaca]|uniref:CU044_5270 family protein n=1 Tax=Nonomuraea aurantiaca TaxID=2878562 RepID=UPI001CD9E404|nr:CU044_5270 family protein [Nonomuraea aurantiaca]MCA2225417.1 CU044_5270 family protein [Nonomuraea aurantiaca]
MNDLEEVASLLAKPEPSEKVAAHSRNRLQHRTRGHRTLGQRMRSRGRVGWFVPGVALVAAGAAAAVVIATGAVTNGGAPAHVIAAAPVSGKDVLLMAAVSAERTPPSSGTYWHVTAKWSKSEMPPMESWTSRDGKRWTRNEPGDTPGTVVPASISLRLKGANVSFDDLEKLPTDPEALKAWIVQRKGNPKDMSASEIQGDPTLTLLALITELPTPAEVRSAAFRALAATPGVENTGAVEGGQALRIPEIDGLKKGIEMVVDPETARVVRANLFLAGNGNVGRTDGYIAVTTDWTDELRATPKGRP